MTEGRITIGNEKSMDNGRATMKRKVNNIAQANIVVVTAVEIGDNHTAIDANSPIAMVATINGRIIHILEVAGNFQQ
jgi:hypothetical protein